MSRDEAVTRLAEEIAVHLFHKGFAGYYYDSEEYLEAIKVKLRQCPKEIKESL